MFIIKSNLGGGISDLAKTGMVLTLLSTFCVTGSVITGTPLLFIFNAKVSTELRKKRPRVGLQTEFFGWQEPGLSQNCVCCRISLWVVILHFKYPNDPRSRLDEGLEG